MTQKISRRRLAKSAAWALPVLAIGVAAPAASASEASDAQWVQLSGLCKYDPHNSGAGKPVQLSLVFSETVYLVSVTVAGTTTNLHQIGAVFTTVTDLIPNKDLSGPNTLVSVTYTVNGQTHTRELSHGSIPDCHSSK